MGVIGLISILSADMIPGLQYDMELLVDFADLIFCSEAMGAIKRGVRGVIRDENSSALDFITESDGEAVIESKLALRVALLKVFVYSNKFTDLGNMCYYQQSEDEIKGGSP